MNIFSVVSRHVDWLSQRLSVAANNVANADTPGFRAQKLNDFRQALSIVQNPGLALTNSSHLQDFTRASENYGTSPQRNADVSHSGNDVSIEKEMQSVGDTSRQMTFDVSLEKIFHHMYLSSLKG